MKPPDDHKPRRNRVQQGREFERLAATHLQRIGYTILERNWRAGSREIDLIAQKENQIVFVEVKSSLSRKFGHPAERVDRRKIQNLTKAAQQYLLVNEIENVDVRFDVITFDHARMEHYPDAFPADSE